MKHLATIFIAAAIGITFTTTLVFADPVALEPGWSVRLVASGFNLNFNGLAFDPVSTDLFTTSFSDRRLYRVTQAGAKTVIQSATDISYDEMAFDPISRIVYFGGVAQTTLRKVDENGVFLEDVTVPTSYTGLAIAPDGMLYVSGQGNNTLLRYNESDDSFIVVATGVGTGVLEGLTFDPDGNAYIAGFGASIIIKVTPGGVVSTLANHGVPLGISYGLGSVFVTDNGPEITRINVDGSGSSVFANGLIRGAGIHFASNGKLYVNSAGEGKLWEFSEMPVPTLNGTWGSIKGTYR